MSRENNIRRVNIIENENNDIKYIAHKHAEENKKIKEKIFDDLYGINYNRAKHILEECIKELGSVSFIKN